MQPVEDIECEVAFQRRDTDMLDGNADVLQRLGGCLDGGCDLRIDRPKARANHPTDAQLAERLATNAGIEHRRAAGKCILAVGSCQLRKGKRDISD